MSASIRPYVSEDLPALYHVCLATGDSGNDASHLYHDWKVLGHIYAGPYAVLSPSPLMSSRMSSASAAISSVRTTPARSNVSSKPTGGRSCARTMPTRPSRAISGTVTSAWPISSIIRRGTPKRICEPYPAHLHINLLPRLQGMKIGRLLIRTWLERMANMGVDQAHLGVGPANERAVRFYQAYGFKEIERLPAPYDVIWFGISTGR